MEFSNKILLLLWKKCPVDNKSLVAGVQGKKFKKDYQIYITKDCLHEGDLTSLRLRSVH